MEVVKFSKNTQFQNIKNSYLDETFALSEKDEDKKKRLEHIWGLRVNNKYSPHQCIEIVMKNHEISRATAYRDYHWAMQIMGDIDQSSKAAEIKVLGESYWNIYQRCINNEDFNGARKALDSYKSLYNFGSDENVIDPQKLAASIYRQILPKPVKKMFKKAAERGVVDLMFIDAEDVEFKEINNEEEEDYE